MPKLVKESSTLALSIVLPTILTVSALAQAPPDAGGPFWELAATAVTPKVVGTAIEQVDSHTIRLGDSTPAGWSVEFVAEEAFQPFGFHASDNQTGRITAIVNGPDGSCAADGENSVRAVLQIAGLNDPAPQGFATISGECFGASAPGAAFNVSFTVVPGR